MTRTKLGLLSLCVVAFGLMAFGATGAQAEGNWLILNAVGIVKTGVELPAVLELEKDKNVEGVEHFVIHSEVLHIKTLYLCSNIKLQNAKIFGVGAIGKGPGEESGARLLLSGCKTFLNGAVAPECEPKSSEGAGTILTSAIHGLALLHQLAVSGVKDDVIKILPDAGETYAVVETGAACPTGSKVPLLGELTLQDCQSLALVHLIKHLLEPFEPLTKLWVISKTTEHVATLLGSAWAFLGGEHKNLEWSFREL
jgi:hypothetical protein